MEQLVLDYDLGEYVTIIDEATTITLRIESIVLFDSGSADIKQVGRDVLKRTGEMLKTLNRDIEVQGHTDSVPINSALFPTNWEPSTKRATNVVLFLVQNSGMDPKRLTATGNGEYRSIVPNDTEAHRQKNRRIDIFIEK
jgi:chemotaxis protein MotB